MHISILPSLAGCALPDTAADRSRPLKPATRLFPMLAYSDLLSLPICLLARLSKPGTGLPAAGEAFVFVSARRRHVCGCYCLGRVHSLILPSPCGVFRLAGFSSPSTLHNATILPKAQTLPKTDAQFAANTGRQGPKRFFDAMLAAPHFAQTVAVFDIQLSVFATS